MKIYLSCGYLGLKLVSAVIAVSVIITLGSICSAQDLLEGKVLHMQFNEGSGNTVIDWANKNHGA